MLITLLKSTNDNLHTIYTYKKISVWYTTPKGATLFKWTSETDWKIKMG